MAEEGKESSDVVKEAVQSLSNRIDTSLYLSSEENLVVRELLVGEKQDGLMDVSNDDKKILLINAIARIGKAMDYKHFLKGKPAQIKAIESRIKIVDDWKTVGRSKK